jgi:hypothetical protein
MIRRRIEPEFIRRVVDEDERSGISWNPSAEWNPQLEPDSIEATETASPQFWTRQESPGIVFVDRPWLTRMLGSAKLRISQ